ncbi:hypothetical protein WBG06_24500 [Nocardioides sp. CCNWLW239]|uniref:hypothetical protein n=1 Tax=Nocardioides sp. CCNWLW239 TaxID=3128902 RepID=UPI003017C70F
MSGDPYKPRTPIIGMVMVFLALAIVGVTAYLHLGWWSLIGYAAAAVIAVTGGWMLFKDVPEPPHSGPGAGR